MSNATFEAVEVEIHLEISEEEKCAGCGGGCKSGSTEIT